MHWAKQSPVTTRQRILEGSTSSARRVNPATAWDVETVVMTAMETEPARRYQTTAAFVQDLSNILENRSIVARRPGPGRRRELLGAARASFSSVGLRPAIIRRIFAGTERP